MTAHRFCNVPALLFLAASTSVALGFAKPIPPSASVSSSCPQGTTQCEASAMATNEGGGDQATATQEWNAEEYVDQYNFVWEFGSSLIDVLDPQPGETILDVGCGTGELVKAIADRGATAMGFDADPNMVEKAQKQFPNLHYFQAFAQEFDLGPERGPVDAIFSNAALHWVSDPEGAVKAMSKALKPGGRFVIEMGGKGNVDGIVTAMLEYLKKPASASPWYFPSIAQYTSLLEKHGIEVTNAVLFDRPTPLNSGADGMRNWIRMFGEAFWHDQSPEEIERMLDFVDEKLKPSMYDGERWVTDYRRLRIIGKKL